MVKSAQYGNFIKNDGTFMNIKVKSICADFISCRIKSLCDGNRSCELTMDANLLPSKFCHGTSGQIYIEYTCVDTNRSPIITKGNYIGNFSTNFYICLIKIKSNNLISHNTSFPIKVYVYICYPMFLYPVISIAMCNHIHIIC